MAKVNLDALVRREDLQISGQENPASLIQTISISNLATEGLIYPFFRKPDFQRETNEWKSDKVLEFIESFINGELIPAIILWRSKNGYYFIIDGAHRISALIAWIYDDYGNGEISKKFYEPIINEEQINIDEETRKLIDKKVGKYKDIISAPHSEKPISNYVERAKNIGAYAIQIQWVNGDAKKAETAFFKINQQASKIDPTELKILQSRNKPNCIAARAIIRGGQGHKYWADFTGENQSVIQKLSKEIHEILYSPVLKTPIKTLDIPIGGKLFSAQSLPLILEFVNMANQIDKNFSETLKDDKEGIDTTEHLKKVRKIAWRINSLHPSSLGLHPIIYFYSIEGNHKPASFYYIVAFLLELERTNTYDDFTKVRGDFENFLVEYDYVLTQITRKNRTAAKGIPEVVDLFKSLISELSQGKVVSDSIQNIVKEEKFRFIKLENQKEEKTRFKNFTKENKSEVFIREAIKTCPKCKICKGYLHRNSISIDHIDRKEDGGLGDTDNGQLTHPYCNTTFKN